MVIAPRGVVSYGAPSLGALKRRLGEEPRERSGEGFRCRLLAVAFLGTLPRRDGDSVSSEFGAQLVPSLALTECLLRCLSARVEVLRDVHAAFGAMPVGGSTLLPVVVSEPRRWLSLLLVGRRCSTLFEGCRDFARDAERRDGRRYSWKRSDGAWPAVCRS